MSSFTCPLIVEYIDGIKWKVEQKFDYYTKSGLTITVPSGFITDFASIPRFFWRVLPPTGKYGKAAVVHDYLYIQGGQTGYVRYTKAESDLIFLEAMEVLGVSRWKRTLMYWAVRIFGEGSF